jgi:Caspase domain/Domain of unknown function (DUF4384)
MTPMHLFKRKSIALILSLSFVGAAFAQSSTLMRSTELRVDKMGSASVIADLPVGSAVQLISLEGGWAQVQASGKSGWVRASSLALNAGASSASTLSAGREAKGNTALTLGVRSIGGKAIEERSNRHALIIGIGRYGDASIPGLPGAHIDRESATQMAKAMQVPTSNITYLQDEQATADGIRNALTALNKRVAEGDRVFIHYSGHGTRYVDKAAGGCVEALLAYEGTTDATIPNKEMATLLSPITNKTDKLFVMYDACHSGGIISNASTVRTRGIFNKNDEGALRPKFAALTEECSKPVNVKTRNLLVEAVAQKALPQDIVHISSSRNDEVSFDDQEKGGLATEFMRDCMLRDAKDLDKSGSISIDEIRQCAQTKINDRMQGDPLYKAHNISLTGNADFVPAWFSQASQTAPQSAATSPTTASAPALTGEQALKRLFDQRDGKRKVEVTAAKTQLKIGQDTVDFSVKSNKAGYVYVALAGSDNKSLYVLFPNDLDKNNRIEAGQTIQLPRSNWKVRSQGPEGTNQLLIFVSDGPRDLSSLSASKAGPFIMSLNNTEGRAELGALMSRSAAGADAACANTTARTGNPQCSDAFGAAMLRIDEVR